VDNAWLTVVLIAGAAIAANLAVVLTAMEARKVSRDDNLKLTMLTKLVRRPMWRLAASLDVGGWILKTLALLVAPLTIVAPGMALGLFLLVGFSYLVLGERVQVPALLGIALLAGGVALVALHSPERTTTVAGPGRWALVVVILLGGALAVFVMRARGFKVDPRMIAISVGFAWALNGVLSKLMADSVDTGRWTLFAVALLSAIAVGALGYTAKTSALQAGHATSVESIVAVINTLVPVALAPVLFGEAWPDDPDDAIQLGMGLVLVGVGVWLLTRSTADVYVGQSAEPAEAAQKSKG